MSAQEQAAQEQAAQEQTAQEQTAQGFPAPVTRPAEIERSSFERIRRELANRLQGAEPAWRNEPGAEDIVRRVIHATADFDFAKALQFTPGAVSAGVSALRGGAWIVTDAGMSLAGISRRTLAALGGEAVSLMGDPAVEAEARSRGVTRAVAAVEHAAARFPAAVYAAGNAPTGLWRLAELVEDGLRPALVIGVPVGFVNVTESKERVWSACVRNGVPAIVSMGRKGGSTVAAAICNAMLYRAAGTQEPEARAW